MTTTELFARAGLALAVGFLIGVERGWKQREEPEGERAAGLRTYTLAALLGATAAELAAHLGAAAFAVTALGFSGAFIAFAWRAADERDRSATGIT